MTSSDDVSQMFDSESQKLQNMIDSLNSKTDTDVPQIVETYYHVINVSSMVTMLKQNADFEPKVLEKIRETEDLISEKFNSEIHPKILAKLSASIQELTNKLQSDNPGEKSKEQIELNARLFEELRQNMSTREFVKQYDHGIPDD